MRAYVCSIGPISFFFTEVLSPLCAISTFNCEQVKPLNFAQLPEKETPCLGRCCLETMSIVYNLSQRAGEA